MIEAPAINDELRLQPANETSQEDEEEGVPMSREAHVRMGLFLMIFGVVFGGGPLAMFIFLIMETSDLIELLLMGLFFSPFILIGGGMFIFGVVTIGAGVIGYPLIKEYDDEEEEGVDEGPMSTAFAYTSEDDVVEQIRSAKAQHAVAETSEKAPTLGWGMATVQEPSKDGGTLRPNEADEGKKRAEGTFWSSMTHEGD